MAGGGEDHCLRQGVDSDPGAPRSLKLPCLLHHPTGEGAGADEFLPLLSLVLAQCDLPELLLEAEYMSELLEPTLLTGEGEGPPHTGHLPVWVGLGALAPAWPQVNGRGEATGHPPPSLSCILPLCPRGLLPDQPLGQPGPAQWPGPGPCPPSEPLTGAAALPQPLGAAPPAHHPQLPGNRTSIPSTPNRPSGGKAGPAPPAIETVPHAEEKVQASLSF